MKPTPANPPERLSVKCKCGKVHTAMFTHYQVIRATCGESYWALQPKRNGPLVLFVWPGHPKK